MLAELLSKEGKKLDYIYVLNSWQTENKKVFVSNDESKNIYYSNEYKEYTAFEYFNERCTSLIDSENIINISLEKVKDKVEVSQALYDFTNQLIELTKDSTINLYVDIHGGLRDSFTVVDSVLMLMKNMYNVNLVDMYSVKQKDVKTGYEAVSVKNEYTIYDFVGGMHEFLSFGRSNGLIKYVEEEMEKESDDSELHEKNQALVDAINMFSDGISLNQAGLFSDRLSELAGKVNGVSYKKNFGIVKQLISNNYVAYIDKIENKNGEQSQYDLLGIEKNYLPAQLKWCLDKDLLQQTLTLIESVMIEFLISEGIVSYPECIEDYKDAFDDWVNLSLFEYGSNRARIMKCNGEECEMHPGQPMSYFKEYTEFFCRMDNDLAEQRKSKNEIENEILRRIYNHRNRSIDPKKYYLKCEYSDYRDCQNGIRAGNMRYERFDIPLVERLRNNSDYVDEFYKLLFIHRGLKMYRNKVSHANAEESIRLSKDDLRRWIELYIEVLDKLMRDAKELLNTNS